MGIAALRVIDTGLDPVTAEREQWDDGNNTLALAPGVVVAYERNVETNARLEAEGIEVLRIAGSELGTGRGGPRCMSCPIARTSPACAPRSAQGNAKVRGGPFGACSSTLLRPCRVSPHLLPASAALVAPDPDDDLARAAGHAPTAERAGPDPDAPAEDRSLIGAAVAFVANPGGRPRVFQGMSVLQPCAALGDCASCKRYRLCHQSLGSWRCDECELANRG